MKQEHSAIIISAQIALGDDGNSYAAQICNQHNIEILGVRHGGWYLPSKYELELMESNKSEIDAAAIANGGTAFADAYYWSSTELLWNSAWMLYLGSGTAPLYDTAKYNSYRVRAVRRF